MWDMSVLFNIGDLKLNENWSWSEYVFRTLAWCSACMLLCMWSIMVLFIVVGMVISCKV